MNESEIMRVFMLPRRIKNSFLSIPFLSPIISLPITAACPLPSPGRKQQRGEERTEAIKALNKDFIFMILFMFMIGKIFCFGIFCFFITEVIREDAPNKPVRRGSIGCWMYWFREAIPRNPARIKIINALIFELFSRYMRKKEAVKSIKGVMFLM